MPGYNPFAQYANTHGYEPREYQGVHFYFNPASGHVLTYGDVQPNLVLGRGQVYDPSRPYGYTIDGGGWSDWAANIAGVIDAALTGWGPALTLLGYGEANKAKLVTQPIEAKEASVAHEAQHAINVVQAAQARADAARELAPGVPVMPPLDFGDHASTQAAIPASASAAVDADKTPASPPLLKSTPPTVWLVLALALGFLAMKG